MIVMSSTNDIITVRREQSGKPINYSDPAWGNSTDCSSVDNYKDYDKDNVKLKDKNNDRDRATEQRSKRWTEEQSNRATELQSYGATELRSNKSVY